MTGFVFRGTRNMNRKEVSSTMVLGTVVFLVLGLLSPVSVYAANGWSDDFNDGNYDHWTVVNGQFSASTFELNTFMSDAGLNTIYHNSTCAYGNWVFELWNNVTDQHIFFISTDWNTNLTEAYSVSLEDFGASLTLYRWNGLVSTVLDTTTLSIVSGFGYHSYNVTRSDMGHFDVLRDGVLELSADDNTITTSEYFIYSLDGIGAIDNIVVSCGITPADDGCTTTTTIFVVIIFILIIVIIVILYKWRYSS
jgi:hypothetical protein